jgi:hypothetical protein
MRSVRLNTPAEAIEYLADALAVVEALTPPDDLRVAVFVKAAELTSAKQVNLTPADFGTVEVPLMAASLKNQAH